MFLDNIGSNIKIQYRTTEDDVINDFYVPKEGAGKNKTPCKPAIITYCKLI